MFLPVTRKYYSGKHWFPPHCFLARRTDRDSSALFTSLLLPCELPPTASSLCASPRALLSDGLPLLAPRSSPARDEGLRAPGSPGCLQFWFSFQGLWVCCFISESSEQGISVSLLDWQRWWWKFSAGWWWKFSYRRDALSVPLKTGTKGSPFGLRGGFVLYGLFSSWALCWETVSDYSVKSGSNSFNNEDTCLQ